MMKLANHHGAYDPDREVLALLPVSPCRVPVELIGQDLRLQTRDVLYSLSNIRAEGFGLSFGGLDGNRVSLARDSAEVAQQIAEEYVTRLYE